MVTRVNVRRSGRLMAVVLAAGLVGVCTSATALGQNGAAAGISSGPVRVVGNPARANMTKMMRRVTIELKESRLEDVMKFIAEVTGAELEPIWSEGSGDRGGLDKDALVTLKANNMAALDLLERVLAKAGKSDTGSGTSTWQFTEYGAIEVGPKERLNESKRTQIYDIKDLLLELPSFPDAPQIDLQGVLQQSQGGSGGRSPFRDDQQVRLTRQQLEDRKTGRLNRLLDILRSSVEAEQWTDSGGSGGTIQPFQDTLIINAPDYMHRQISGYGWWPQARPMVVNGKRYVSMITETGISKIDGFGRQAVTGVVPGSGAGGGGGGGGGGGSGGGGGGTPTPTQPPAKPGSPNSPPAAQPPDGPR